jgi:hypothetical protein
MNTLRVPPEDFYQLIFEFPKKRFLPRAPERHQHARQGRGRYLI